VVTINSDDPAYFGGYINDNDLDTFESLGLEASDAIAFAKCSFEASFISQKRKRHIGSKSWMRSPSLAGVA
jgi:adenosine deaminase